MKKAIATLALSLALLVPICADASAAVTQPGLSTKRTEMLAQLNAQRKTKCGANSLALKTVNNTAASRHSVDMAANSFLSHTSSDGTGFAARMALYGVQGAAGENIMRGGGADTAALAHYYFYNHTGHKENLMNCTWKFVGVGYAFQSSDAYGDYWVVDFSSK